MATELLYYPLDIFFESPAAGFVLSFILNIIYFGILSYIFIRPQIKGIGFHKFLIGILGMTGAMVAADFIPFYLFGIANVASYAPHFVLNFALLAAINFSLARYHFKAPASRSLIIGLIMGMLTNAYLVWVTYAP